VPWIFRKLWGRRGGDAPLVCYLRENGPIAYALGLFGPDPRACVDTLFDTGFAWFWLKDHESSEASRDWTQLTRWSMGALLSDLDSASDTGRNLTLLGLSSPDPPNDLNDDQVVALLEAFAADRQGPLQVVVRRLQRSPDGGRASEQVFAAQHPVEAVRALMHAWGIDPIKAERRAYARLHGATLEDWLRALKARRDADRCAGNSSSAP
jgi:hypothetical protein